MKYLALISLILLSACAADVETTSFFSERCVISQDITCDEFKLINNTLIIDIETETNLNFLSANITSFGSSKERLDRECVFQEQNVLVCEFKEIQEQNKSLALRANIETLDINNNSRTFEADLFVRVR
ncbi:MAG: hypothetical protein ACMXX6_01470 [Candidatus Woesearchaeota archaeon]